MTLWIAFTLSYAIMAVAPGPVVLLVMSYALSQGRRTALAVVAGTVLGDATCLLAAVFGLGAVLSASAAAFTLVKLVGAGYLVLMGVALWRAKAVPARDAPPSEPGPFRRVFLRAYLVTVLNPKSVLFFLVFVPQFIDSAAPLAPQLVGMLASVAVCGVLVDGGYSVFASSLRGLIRTARAQRAVNRVCGGLLIGEGIAAAAWRGVAAAKEA